MYIVCVCVCVYVCDGNFSMTIEHTITIRDEKEATENECKTYFIVFEITHESFSRNYIFTRISNNFLSGTVIFTKSNSLHTH